MKWIIYLYLIILIIPLSLKADEWELQNNIKSKYLKDIDKVELYKVYFINEKIGWVVGYYNIEETETQKPYGVILKTEDSGEEWNDLSPMTQTEKLEEDWNWMGNKFMSVYFIDESNGWIVGSEKVVAKSIDGGKNWQMINYAGKGDPWIFNDIYLFSKDSGVIVGYRLIYENDKPVESGRCIYYLGEDKLDKIEENTDYSSYKKIWAKDKDFIWIVGHNAEYLKGGVVKLLSKGGYTLSNDISPSKKNYSDMEWSWQWYQGVNYCKGYLWVVGSKNTILFSKDLGKSWEVKSNYKDFENVDILHQIFFTTPNYGMAVGGKIEGNEGYIYITTDGGYTWKREDTLPSDAWGVELRDVYFPSFKLGWVVGDKATILKFTQKNSPYPNSKSRLFAYPNPFIPYDNEEKTGDYSKGIAMENLYPGSKVKIYTISGEFIEETPTVDNYGRVTWKVKESLASGIYILKGRDIDNNLITGKVMIIK
jgi:photosystem II stability/assembly factor-like uncharacterized protein